jgi:zinc transport system substrate-binding protein
MWEPDEVPDEAAWSGLGYLLREHPAQWMIWEGEPNTESVQRLRNLGVESRVFDPAGNRPQDGDFLDVMQQNVKNLQQVFK